MTTPPQRRIGLTGGIASGKSSVGRLLAMEHGLPLLDADAYAREVLAPGTPTAAAVLARYGAAVRERGLPAAAHHNEIDRKALGRIVFADPSERRWLEDRIHPLVRARFLRELSRLEGLPTVVLMVPLLFEAGMEGLCSTVWLVDCDEEQQMQRLMARDGCSDADARARIAAQWPLARKRRLADVVIDNREPASSLPARVERALRSDSPPATPTPNGGVGESR